MLAVPPRPAESFLFFSRCLLNSVLTVPTDSGPAQGRTHAAAEVCAQIKLLHIHIKHTLSHTRNQPSCTITYSQLQALPEVAHVLQLERWLMEGAYNKVLASSKANMASDLHALMVGQLAMTVRWVEG